MNRLLIFSILIFLISCKAKQAVYYDTNPSLMKQDSVKFFDILEGIRPQYENRFPSTSDYYIVDSFFKTWSDKSIPINQVEFDKLDSIEQLGYELYETLIADTSFIGIVSDKIKTKYILIPNTLNFGFADTYRFEYGIVFCDNIKSVTILNFRPRVSFDKKQILYYTKEYQDTLPKFSEKYGVAGFISVDSYLMTNYLRYFETAPVISGIVKILNSDEYIIRYKSGSRSYETVAKRENNKWIKINDLTILESD